jgi:cell division protein FtsZ
MIFQFADPERRQATIKVLGLGGGGNNAVNNMIAAGLVGVDFIAANTDLQALENSQAKTTLQLGQNLTRGLGAGGDPEIGRQAALEDRDALREILDGADMVFLTAGMGGGTGTGSSPIAAEIARELKALTVAVVTKPFTFEGNHRKRIASEGIAELKRAVDTLIVIPNDRLFAVAGKKATMLEALKLADEVLINAVQGISDLIVRAGHWNVDFADVRKMMEETGVALMGTGVATGEGRSLEAAQRAIQSPLLDDIRIDGARGVLVNITASSEVTLEEFQEASTLIQEAVHPEAKIKCGLVMDDQMADEFRVTVIATGIGAEARMAGGGSRLAAVGGFPAPKSPAAPDARTGNMDRIYTSRFDSGPRAEAPRETDLDMPTFIRQQAD